MDKPGYHQKLFTRSNKKYPGMAIMNPERLISPRPPNTARNNPTASSARRIAPDPEESSRGSSRGLRQYQSLTWVEDGKAGVEKDIFDTLISREQTAPSLHIIESINNEMRPASQSLTGASAPNPPQREALAKNPKNLKRATSPQPVAQLKTHERVLRFGEEAMSVMKLGPVKVHGKAKANRFDSEDTPSDSDESLEEQRPPRTGAERYRRQSVLRGAGFSSLLLRLDPLAVGARACYPTPSEALGRSRFNRRLQHAVQTVGAVGLPPPKLDELFFAAQDMKRQWVMQFRLEPRAPTERATAPAAKRPRFGRVAHTSGGDGTTQGMPTLAGGSDVLRSGDDADGHGPASKPTRRLSPLFPSATQRPDPRPHGDSEDAGSPREPRDVLIEVSDSDAAGGWQLDAFKPRPVPPPASTGGARALGGPAPPPVRHGGGSPHVPALPLGKLRRMAREQRRRAATARGGSAERLPSEPVRTAGSPWDAGHMRARNGALTYREPAPTNHNDSLLASLGFGPTGEVGHAGGGGSAGGARLPARSATTRSLASDNDRILGLRALARRQAAAHGNRVLAKATAAVRMLDLLQAVRSLGEAREIYAKANLLEQKQSQLEELEVQVQEARQGLHDLRESLRTPPPPPPPRPPRINFTRDPDRAAPEGLLEAWLPLPKPKVPDENSKKIRRNVFGSKDKLSSGQAKLTSVQAQVLAIDDDASVEEATDLGLNISEVCTPVSSSRFDIDKLSTESRGDSDREVEKINVVNKSTGPRAGSVNEPDSSFDVHVSIEEDVTSKSFQNQTVSIQEKIGDCSADPATSAQIPDISEISYSQAQNIVGGSNNANQQMSSSAIIVTISVDTTNNGNDSEIVQESRPGGSHHTSEILHICGLPSVPKVSTPSNPIMAESYVTPSTFFDLKDSFENTQKTSACELQGHARMAIIRFQYGKLYPDGLTVSKNIPELFPFFQHQELQTLQSFFRGRLTLHSYRDWHIRSSFLTSILKSLLARTKYRKVFESALHLIVCVQRHYTPKIYSMRIGAMLLQAACRSAHLRNQYVDLVFHANNLYSFLARSCIQKKWCRTVIAGRTLCRCVERANHMFRMLEMRSAAASIESRCRRLCCCSLYVLRESAKKLEACVFRTVYRTNWLEVKSAVLILSLSLLRSLAYIEWKKQQPSEIRRRAALYLLDVVQAKLTQKLYNSQLRLDQKIREIDTRISQRSTRHLVQTKLSTNDVNEINKLRGILHELKQERADIVEEPVSVSWLAYSMCRIREKLLLILQNQQNHEDILKTIEMTAMKAAEAKSMDSDEQAGQEERRHKSNMLVLSNALSMEHPDDQRIEKAIRHEVKREYPEALLLLTQAMNETKFRLLVLLKRAFCFSNLGMNADALNDLAFAIHEFPKDWRAYFFRALLFTELGRTDDALQDLSISLKVNPSLSIAYVMRANLALEEGRYMDAISDLNIAVKLRFDDSALYILRARAFKKLKKSLLSAYDFERSVMIHIERIMHLQTSGSQFEVNQSIRQMRLSCTDKVLINMCLSFLETENPDLALKILMSVISVDPSRPIVYSLLGHVKSYKGDFEDAEKDFERAVAEDPFNSNTLLFRALFLRNMDPASSLLDLKQSIELDERNSKACFVMGRYCEAQQDWQGALKSYWSVMTGDDDDDNRLLEATIRYSELSLQMAGADISLRVAAFKNLIFAGMRFAPALEPLVTLARLYARFGEYSKAIKAVCRAIHMFPSETSLYTLRSRLLTESAHFQEGNRDALRGLFLQDTKDLLVCKQIAQVKMKLGMNHEAKIYLEGLLQQNPKNADFECLLGSVYFNLGDVKRAFQHLSEAIRIQPFSGEHYGARAKVYAHEREFPKAIADYSNALKVSRMETDFYYGRAVCLFESGKNDEALQDLHIVIGQDPNHTYARFLRGILLEQNGQKSMACEDYNHALAYLHSKHQDRRKAASKFVVENQVNREQLAHHRYLLCLRRGALMSRRCQYAVAIQDYNEALGINPNCEMALLQRGNAYHLHGYFSSACLDYSRCLDIDPSNELARKNRALARMAQKKWNESLADFALIPEAKRDAKTWLSLVDCYRAVKDFNKALMAAEKALLLASNAMCFHGFIGLNKLLTRCLVTKGDVEEDAFPRSRATLRTLVRAVHLLPSSNFARLKLAFALFGRGSLTEAAAQLQVVTLSDPSISLATELAAMIHAELGNLHLACSRVDNLILNEQNNTRKAQLLCSRGVLQQRLKDLPHAEHHYWQSSQLSPETSETQYNLGCLHMQRENWFLAKIAFDRAVAAKPRNDLALLNRSVVLYHLGKTEAAIADLNKALLISPELGQAYLNRATIKSTIGQVAEAEKDLIKAVHLLMGQDSAQPCLFEAKHIINKELGCAIDTLPDYSQLLEFDETCGSQGQSFGEDLPKQSLWFKCFLGKLQI